MYRQENTPERLKRSIRATKRAIKRARLKRKRRAMEAIHESCLARTARRMLWDCDLAIRGLPMKGANQAAWRNGWFGVVTLLRAIGHGLKNEDAKRSTYLNEAIATAWQRWKVDLESCQIFYGFIDDERNALLKQYQFRNERKIYSFQPQECEDGEAAGQHLVLIGGRAVAPCLAIRIAWEWWRAEIARIERHAANVRQLHTAR
jgi:hypothetical protein